MTETVTATPQGGVEGPPEVRSVVGKAVILGQPTQKFHPGAKVSMRKTKTDLFEYMMIVDSAEYDVARAGWDYKLKEDPSMIKYGPRVWETNLQKRK